MTMNDQEIANLLEPLRIAVKAQGDIVRRLKEDGANDIDLKKAIHELKARKKLLEDKELSLTPTKANFDKAKLEDLLIRRFFVDNSFAIYGGITGQYDFGPMGCAMKANLLNYWRQHFILEEQLLEVDCTSLTPESVLKASGHVDRFADYMVKDLKTGECFRVDHLIKASLEKLVSTNKKLTDAEKAEIEETLVRLDGFTKEEMTGVVRKYNIKSPITGNEVTDAMEFNLMFSTMIGPTGKIHGYLRPETAQGIFVNFKRLLDFNQGKLPFGVAQIGNAFRNEISPRSFLVRVREFTMAEIEYFIDPEDKNCSKFHKIKDIEVNIYSACTQMAGQSTRKMTIGNAVAEKIIANEILGYFMARVYLFLIRVGIDKERFRFRQHLNNEMAHYACDCWDAECLTSYGWLECVGCADRSCYDLNQHAKATKVKLVAEKQLKEPVEMDMIDVIPNKALIGKEFKANAKDLIEHLIGMDKDEVEQLEIGLNERNGYDLKLNENNYLIKKEMITIKKYKKTVHVREFVPSVIEPSFGIGRIMYSIWEHNFCVRDGDEARTYIALPPLIAPYKCSVLPLSSNEEFIPFSQKISSYLTANEISHKLDDSKGSIGRRYARTDEITIPFGITIDFDTLKAPHSVTLRERDSMQQIRVPLDEIGSLVKSLSTGQLEWADAVNKYPKFEHQESTAKD